MDDDRTHASGADFESAAERGRRLLAASPRVIAARHEAGRIVVELDNGCAFAFPVDQAQGLAGAKASDLAEIEIEAAGLGLYWPKLDADFYVPSLLKGVSGTRRWMAHVGAAGGRATSEAKAEAARANGKRGGRPKKTAAPRTV